MSEDVRQKMWKMLLKEVIHAINMDCHFKEDNFTVLNSV